MKLKIFAMIAMAALAGCCNKKGTEAEQALIGRTELTAEEVTAGIMTPEVMYKMGRVGAPAVSEGKIAYSVSWYSVSENRSTTNIIIEGEGTVENASQPQWAGTTLYFMRNGQVWSANAQGADIKQVTDIEGGVDAFGVAPTGDNLYYAQKVRTAKRESKDVYPDMAQSKVLIYDDLMERHWDYWDRGDYSHIFIAPLKDVVKTGTDIMPGEEWDAPMAPYFDAAEIAWSNNGAMLAYTCKKLTGTEYALSTNSDIYLYDLAAGTTKNLTEGMVGYDKYPLFSPDDTRIAWRSMERPGNESDKDRLFTMAVDGSDKKYLTEAFDYNATNFVWRSNDEIIFRAPMEATHQLCSVPVAGGEVRVLTKGDHDINEFSLDGDNAIAGVTTLQRPTELFKVALDGGQMTAISDVNGFIYDKIKVGEVQKRWVPTSDGKQMLTWVVLPVGFDASKSYPTLLYCQGGPQSVVSQAWSYRWNPQLMAAQGYIVVMPNRRGLPSFGQEWLDQISGDYSGQNIRDYLAAIDNVSAEPWSDENRMACVGASYGGYSSYFLAGHHEGRFKAFIAHCGMFDFVSKFGSTEELFFPMNDLGGAYWDKGNAIAQRSFTNSPHNFVQNWDTPILIFTGLQDFRIPYTQSLEAFTAARMRGIPARLVAFENEAHQVFGAQNAIVWNREFFGWLKKYLN